MNTTKLARAILLIGLFLVGASSSLLFSQETDPTTDRLHIVDSLYTGELKEGVIKAKAYLVTNPEDEEIRFALGLLQYSLANEQFAQAIYLYGGLNSSEISLFTNGMVAHNPSPKPVTYSDCRRIAQTYYENLLVADDTFQFIKNKQTKLYIDFDRIRYDTDGSGTINAHDRLFDQRTLKEGEIQEQFLCFFDLLLYRFKCHIYAANLNGILKYDQQRFFDLSSAEWFARPLPKKSRVILGVNEIPKSQKDLLSRTIMGCGQRDNLSIVEKERSQKSLEQAIEAILWLRSSEEFRTLNSEEFKSMGLTKEQVDKIKHKLHSEENPAIRIHRLREIEQLLLGTKLMPHPKLQS